jgi:ubiquinone/menaquinone biosynthesis C-methylase UbiE
VNGSAAVELALPALGESIATPAARSGLLTLARSLPAIDRGGFEVRLAGGVPQVDLQQCVEPRDRQRLLDHLGAADPGDGSALATLAARWADPADAWHKQIVELWLEWDRPSGARAPSQPAVFVGLWPERTRQAEAREAVDSVVALLLEDVPRSWLDRLARCFDAPEPAIVSHVGVMLSRPGTPLRVNVKRLQRDTLTPYLEAVGWPGDTSALATQIAPLWSATDGMTACLDITADVAPALGLELIVKGRERWEDLLDLLVDSGWCEPDKRSALLAWPGVDSPPSVGTAWPGRLLVEALLRPARELGVVERRLSHVKVTLATGSGPQAKAYLWFGHRWLGQDRPAPLSGPVHAAHLDRVRDYYERSTQAYVDYLGTTFQGWLFGTAGDVPASNRALAERAGISTGERVLDAGCGVGGPAIDIARALDVDIDGITISPTQVRIADGLLADAGLDGRVRVQLGDYHELPWPDEAFDVVVFLESAGQSLEQPALFAEVHRVLRPGGAIYVNDAFTHPADRLTAAERRALAAFDRVMVYRTRTLAQTREALVRAGFVIEREADLSDQVTGDRWRAAVMEHREGMLVPTPFGVLHEEPAEPTPIFCGEIFARKPREGSSA